MNSKKTWEQIKEAFQLCRLGKGCDNDFLIELIQKLEFEVRTEEKRKGKKNGGI